MKYKKDMVVVIIPKAGKIDDNYTSAMIDDDMICEMPAHQIFRIIDISAHSALLCKAGCTQEEIGHRIEYGGSWVEFDHLSPATGLLKRESS